MKRDGSKELQSRRAFFKNAAKAALPVLGAVVLSQLPVDAMATSGCSVCSNSCRYGCDTGCQSTCIGGCKTNCKGGNYGH